MRHKFPNPRFCDKILIYHVKVKLSLSIKKFQVSKIVFVYDRVSIIIQFSSVSVYIYIYVYIRSHNRVSFFFNWNFASQCLQIFFIKYTYKSILFFAKHNNIVQTAI